MSAEPVARSAGRDRGRPWVIATVLLTTMIGLLLMFLPTYTTVEEPGGIDRQSLVEHEGWDVAAILAIPVLIGAVPLLAPARHRRWVTVGVAALFGLAALVSVASVGLFYVPSATLLVVAAVRTRRQREA
jgi:hypothetical protein